jgi:23S rRNA-intervening sequence protein
MNEKDRYVKSYRDLLVWQKAMSLAITMYKTTKSFPVDERYGLTTSHFSKG